MVEQIANAIQNEDFATAKKLLDDLQNNDPLNPWINFYVARLQEAEGNNEVAYNAYVTILRTSTHPKIAPQARKGIKRLEQIKDNQKQVEQDQREAAINQAMQTPENRQMGLLILEPMPNEEKQAAAKEFAKIMGTDAYSARLKLPSRSWRCYTTGEMGKLNIYAEALKKANIPCFTASLDAIQKLVIYPVLFIESIQPKVTLVYEPSKGQRDILTFRWSDVSQRVEGMLPIFEECVERGVRGKLQRKTKILDYAKFCDFHLPKSKVILRFCDHSYQFNQGYSLISPTETVAAKNTSQDYWIHFTNFISQNLPTQPVWSDFTPFAETAFNFAEILKQIDPKINLLRREESLWDAAFEVYSGLAFLKQ
ncbi:MAG: tetratricopeptide repeat protein [Microcystaceae cyanobacterium]